MGVFDTVHLSPRVRAECVAEAELQASSEADNGHSTCASGILMQQTHGSLWLCLQHDVQITLSHANTITSSACDSCCRLGDTECIMHAAGTVDG